MKCSKCNSEVPDGSKFCSSCGTPVSKSRLCAKCGSEANLTDRFCGTCGSPLNEPGTAAPPVAAPPAATPPKPSAAPAEPEIPGGFRKHVTVIFVDIKANATQATMDPEEAKEILAPALDKVSSIVSQYGGIVIKTTADGLIGAFGAPEALEDHSLRGCMASIAIQKQIKSMGPNLISRIGLNSGEILFTVDGSKYDIVGAPVNLAARMEQTAEPDTIRISTNTLKQVSSSVDYQSLGTIEIKGFGDPIEVFLLKGIKSSQSVKEFTNQFINCISYINRDVERARVAELVVQAKAGHGSALSLVADSGIGKSRFMFEIVRSEAAKDFKVLLAASFVHTKDIPMMPIANLFANLFDLSRSETDIEKIKATIKPFVDKVETPFAMNAALSLLNLAPKDPDWIALEPAMKRRYTFELGTKLIIQQSLASPLLLIFEDLHWVDSESELYIDSLISQIGNQKIFILIGYRPEYHDHWTNKPNYATLRLQPLNEEGQSLMLDNLLGKDPSLIEIKKRLLGIVGGNPFFLEELIYSLISEKVFSGEPKNYRLKEGTQASQIKLPETIMSIYQIKIDKLPPLEKKILQVASVIGTKFLYSTLTQLLELVDQADLRKALTKLIELQYIYESQLYPEPGFGFTHALTYETAYNSILKKQRKALHFKLFQVLEASLKDDQIDVIQIVADQAFMSEAWDKAIEYAVKAANIVYEMSAFSTCVKLYEKALSAIQHLPSSEELLSKTMKLHYELYYAYVPLGRFKEQFEHLTKALEIALTRKDRFYESILHSALGIYFSGFKDAKEGLTHAQNAYTIGVELKSAPAIAIAEFTLFHIQLFMAQFKDLISTYQDFEKQTNNAYDYRSEWMKAPMGHISLLYESWGRSHIGDFAIVESRKEKWFASSKNLERPSIPNVCRYGAMGMNCFIKGDFEKGIEYSTIALQYSLSTEVIILTAVFYAILAKMYFLTNKPTEGKVHLDRGIQIIDALHGTFTTAFGFAAIADALLISKEIDKAKEFCTKSIEIAKQRNVLLEYPLLLKVSAEIELQAPQPKMEEVKQKLDEALKLMTDAGMQPHIGRCHMIYADYYKKLNDAPNAQASTQAAVTIFDKLGMKYWSDRAKT